jgi:hypothetical protein
MIEIPELYRSDLGKVIEIQEQVEKTHPSLSTLTLASVLFDISNKALLITGISGTGKSEVAQTIQNNAKRYTLSTHGITVNGLRVFAEQLSNNTATIIVEDLARSGTDYTQIQTLAVLSGLTYSGYISKQTANLDLQIYNCKASALIYSQPLILKKLVAVNEFESDIRDKCIRYYHLHMPIEPNPAHLNAKFTYKTLDRSNVILQVDNKISKYYMQIQDNLEHEVSKARAIEYTQTLLRASACLNDRTKVVEADAWLIAQITKICRLEKYIYTKESLEGARQIDENLLPLLTVLYSYKKIKLTELARLFQVETRQAYNILQELGKYVLVNSKTLYPTKYTLSIFKEVGVYK